MCVCGQTSIVEKMLSFGRLCVVCSSLGTCPSNPRVFDHLHLGVHGEAQRPCAQLPVFPVPQTLHCGPRHVSRALCLFPLLLAQGTSIPRRSWYNVGASTTGPAPFMTHPDPTERTHTLTPVEVKDVLVLGLGGGALPQFLLSVTRKRRMCITAVEHDPGVVAVARHYFGLIPSRKMGIHVRDAKSFLQAVRVVSCRVVSWGCGRFLVGFSVSRLGRVVWTGRGGGGLVGRHCSRH